MEGDLWVVRARLNAQIPARAFRVKVLTLKRWEPRELWGSQVLKADRLVPPEPNKLGPIPIVIVNRDGSRPTASPVSTGGSSAAWATGW